ncbi:MAG: YeeE/YedE thiosulfate transporter family protein [Myxococcales bacterium]
MLLALFGGILIGLSASLAHAGARQVAGVSGILGGLLRGPVRPLGFGLWFVAGLVLGGALLARFGVPVVSVRSSLPERPLLWILAAGLLVGFGTRLGSGCTSGHGVCGISRLSPRSLVATGVFMVTAALVVLLTRHVFPTWGGG